MEVTAAEATGAEATTGVTVEEAMAATIAWFGSYYERVARVVGDRQRRVLVAYFVFS